MRPAAPRLELVTVKRPLGSELRGVQSESVPDPSIYGDTDKSGRKAPPLPERWLRGMTNFTATGRLKSLNRIATIAGHFEIGIPPHRDGSQHQKAPTRAKNIRPREGLTLGPLGVQLKKNVKTLVYIENLLSAPAFNQLFQILDRTRLTFANIFDALYKEDLSLIVYHDRLPLPSNSAVVPFLLLILYVKLITKTSGNSDVVGLFTYLRKKPPQIDLPVPIELFIAALAERRVRFFNFQRGHRNVDPSRQAPQRSTLYWNERFEHAEVAFLTDVYRSRELLRSIKNTTGSQAGIEQTNTAEDRARRAVMDIDQMQQFEEAIIRISENRDISAPIVLAQLRLLSLHRKYLHPSFFNPKSVGLLEDLLENPPEAQFRNVILEDCLYLLTTWLRILAETDSTLSQGENKEIALLVLRGVTLVESLLQHTPGSLIFALCIAFLGASVGITGAHTEKSYAVVADCLANESYRLRSGKHLATVLTGVGDMIIAAPIEKIQPIVRLVLQIWVNPPAPTMEPVKVVESQPPWGVAFPSFEEGLVLFRLFRYILVSRASKGTAAHRGRSDDNPMAWAHLLAAECCIAFDGKDDYTHPSIPYVALFAAGGLLRGIFALRTWFELEKREEELIKDCVEILNDLIARALHTPPLLEFSDEVPFWPHAVALVAVNAKEAVKLPKEDDMLLLLRLVLGVFIEHGIPFHWIFEGIQASDNTLQSKIERFKAGTFFRQVRNFTETLGVLFHAFPSGAEGQNIILDSLMRVSEDLYNSWKVVLLGGGKRNPAIPEGFFSVIQTIFVSYYLFFSTVTEAMTGEQSLIALQALSYLQFGRVDSSLYDKATHQIAMRAATSEEMMYRIVDLLPAEAKNSDSMDETTAMRLYYFMTAMEPLIAHFPEKLLADTVLPLLFGLLSHTNIRLNKKAHRLFAMLFAGPRTPLPRLVTPPPPPSGVSSFVMKVIPYYLKVSLDHYSDSLLPFESFTECFETIVHTLPHSHPLFIFCFEKLAERILLIEKQNQLHNQAQQQQQQQNSQPLGADLLDDPTSMPQQQYPLPSAVSSKNLAVFLFTHMNSVDIQVLDLLLEIMATVVAAYDGPKKAVMCNYLYELISKNFDYTRKTQCLNWYLTLVHYAKQQHHQQQQQYLHQQQPQHQQIEPSREAV